MKTIQTSFSGGEQSPEMFGNVGDPKLRSGAQTIRNFVCRPSGAVARRPGTKFVAEVGDSTKKVRLIPFRYSIDQTLCIQVGEGYFRFHTDGGTVLFATERRVASVSTGGDTITFTAAHGLSSDDPIRLFRDDGGAIMAGLTSGQTYYAIPTSTTTIQVSASPGPGAAVDITGSGSGVQSAWLNSECPPLYIASRNSTATVVAVSSVNTGTEEITSATHSLTTGDAVAFDAAVGGLTAGTIYYAFVVSATVIKVCATRADALAGVTFINLTAATIGNLIDCSKITVALGHAVASGDPINFTVGGGTIITGLVADTTYYAVYVSATVMRLATTEALALAGTYIDVVTGAGTGVTKFHYIYEVGDLVTNINTPQGFFYCSSRNPQAVIPGTASHWHQMPMDGTFELPNGFIESNLPNIDYAQSNDVLRLAHPDFHSLDLQRVGATEWILSSVVAAASLSAPTGVTATPTYGQALGIDAISVIGTPATITTNTVHNFTAGLDTVCIFGATVIDSKMYVVESTPAPAELTIRQQTGQIVSNSTAYPGGGRIQAVGLSSQLDEYYKVTAVDENNSDSLPSSAVQATNNLLVPGAKNTISWAAVTGAVRYNVFRLLSGVYGYIGSTETTSFDDDNIDPDLSVTIPYQDATLTDYNPGAVAFFNQRSVFGGFESLPQNVLTSRVGSLTDFSFHIPLIDTDRIAFEISALSLCRIQFFVPLSQLLVLTDSTEFRIVPLGGEVLTPTNRGSLPFSYVGCAKVKPQVTNSSVLFAAARGGHVYEAGFQNEAGGYVTNDLCLRAAHLFDGLSVTHSTQQKAPVPVVWWVSSSGSLLGITYVPGEGIGAWHQHDTEGGTIEDCCAVAEGDEDALYLSVKRTINGSDVRYIERMSTFYIADRDSAFFVDCGLTYDGAATQTITGLDHLEGETVAILADGRVVDTEVVSGGSVSLDKPAAKVHVGLPITSQILTAPWAAQIEAAGQGRTKNVNRAFVRVKSSGPFHVGPDEDHLSPTNPTRDLVTGEVDVTAVGNWNRDGGLLIQTDDPLPLTIVGLTIEVAT